MRAGLCITIVDEKAADIAKGFFERYPMRDPSVTPSYFGIPPDKGTGMELPVVQTRIINASVDSFCRNDFALACKQWGVPGTIYVCLGDDIETDRIGRLLIVALERAVSRRESDRPAAPQCTIVKAMRRWAPLGQVGRVPPASSSGDAQSASLIEVDVLRSAANAVICEDLYRLAENAHRSYIDFSMAKAIPAANLVEWDALDAEAKQMNLNATDLHLVRLREAGVNVTALALRDGRLHLHATQLQAVGEYLNLHREEFAAAEHRRWTCDKFLFGWRYVSGTTNVKPARLNCSLVGYEQLDENVKQYDRANLDRWRDLLPPAT